MPVSAKWFGNALIKALNKEVDWDTDAIRVTLHSGAIPDQDVVDYWDDVVASELPTGNGYTAGGVLLTTKVINYTAATNVIKLDADDVVWASPTSLSATWACIRDDTPATNATKPVLGFVDFGGTLASTNAEYKITWDPAGIFTITLA